MSLSCQHLLIQFVQHRDKSSDHVLNYFSTNHLTAKRQCQQLYENAVSEAKSLGITAQTQVHVRCRVIGHLELHTGDITPEKANVVIWDSNPDAFKPKPKLPSSFIMAQTIPELNEQQLLYEFLREKFQLYADDQLTQFDNFYQSYKFGVR